MLTVHIENQTRYQVEGVEEFVASLLKLLDYNPKHTELTVNFCSDDFIQSLNDTFRDKNYPTDVLSFPAHMDGILGDIAISMDTAKRQAKGSLSEEVQFLLCHGILHLLGYEDETEEGYEIMIETQNSLLALNQQEIKIYENKTE